MIYTVDDILRDVRIAIDENRVSEQLLAELDSETLSLNEVVCSKIVEGIKRTLQDAPLHKIDGGEEFGDAIYWNANLSGWILLPNDFLRLLIFKMSDWERPVYAAITAADPRYALQHSRCKGLRGTPQKPVVALTSRQEGRVLELYSCKSKDATVEQALYLPIPKIDEDNGINIPEECYQSAIYMIASLALATMGQNERSGVMRELSKQSLS